MKLSFAAALIAFASTGPALVSAWATGAGTCRVTPYGPAFPESAPHANQGRGDLSVDEYRVEVDGVALSASSLVDVGPLSSLTLEGTPSEITVGGGPSEIAIGGGPDFIGFLITLSSPDGRDLSGALIGDDETARGLNSEEGGGGEGSDAIPPFTMSTCPAGIAGGTHRNNDEKSSVTMRLDPNAVGTGAVDVTVTVMQRQREWYHSNFVMNVLGPSSAGGGTGTGTATTSATGSTAAATLPASAADAEPAADDGTTTTTTAATATDSVVEGPVNLPNATDAEDATTTTTTTSTTTTTTTTTSTSTTTRTTTTPYACDLCSGRGGHSVVLSEKRSLEFLPKIERYGSTTLGVTTCDRLLTELDLITVLLADPDTAVGQLGMSGPMTFGESCGAFQKLGSYCGCRDADPPCRICGEGQKVANPGEYMPGTSVENVMGFEPTCGFYNDLYLPNLREGSSECGAERGMALQVCSCEGVIPTMEAGGGSGGVTTQSSPAASWLASCKARMAAPMIAGLIAAPLLGRIV